MTVSFLLSLATLAGQPALPSPPSATAGSAALQDDANEVPLEERLAACGEDTDKLMTLAAELKSASKYADARKVMERVIEIDPEHAEARKGLGHQKYGGRWFKSSVELMMYRREEEKAMREKGLVRLGDEWVPIADAPYLRMGWEKDESGRWRDPNELARLEQEAKYRDEGWGQQDLVWIPPDELGKIDEGLWKCGDEWLSLDAANAFHAKIGQQWRYPSELGHFVVNGTCTRQGVEYAAIYADAVYPDLVRAYGVEPSDPPDFLVLNSLEQYNALAAGDQAQGLPAAEATGFSSVHHAFFADSLFDPTSQPPRFLGCGVAYWDYSPNLEPWGKFSIRHAAALSYAEAIDPSWNAVSQAVANPSGGFQAQAFWSEKKIPAWFRYGVANWVETYAADQTQGGEPYMNRDWAFGLVKSKGGLRPLPEVFAFNRDLNDIPGSNRLMYEAGLVVSFVMDGGNAEVEAAHEAWKEALAKGEGTEEAMTALQEAIVAHEDDLRAFAGLDEEEETAAAPAAAADKAE